MCSFVSVVCQPCEADSRVCRVPWRICVWLNKVTVIRQRRTDRVVRPSSAWCGPHTRTRRQAPALAVVRSFRPNSCQRLCHGWRARGAHAGPHRATENGRQNLQYGLAHHYDCASVILIAMICVYVCCLGSRGGRCCVCGRGSRWLCAACGVCADILTTRCARRADVVREQHGLQTAGTSFLRFFCVSVCVVCGAAPAHSHH